MECYLGSKRIVVAVIDTGIDVFHKDLKGNYGRTQETVTDSNGKKYPTALTMIKMALWIFTAGILFTRTMIKR